MGSTGPDPNGPRVEAPDLEEIEQGRRLLGALGSPVEFWEALCLSGTAPLTDGAAADPLNPVVKGAIQRGLRDLRQELGPLARELRVYLERVGAGFETAHSERVIGFILASETERAAARRWLADPLLAHEAADRIARISSTVEMARPTRVRKDPVPSRLFRAAGGRAASTAPERLSANESDAALSAAGCPEAVVRTLRPEPISDEPELPTVSFQELPSGGCPFAGNGSAGSASAPVASRLESDVRRARAWTELYRNTPARIELWEAVFLLSTLGETVRPVMEDLLKIGKADNSPAFQEGTAYLSRQIQGIRSEWGWFAARLRGYLEPLFKGRPSEEVFETALGFLLSAPIGRERAIRWLDQPDRFKGEAEAYMKTVLEIAERSFSAAA